MRDHIVSLLRQQTAARTRLGELDTAAGDRPLTPEQQTQWETVTADLRAITQRLEQAQEAERMAAQSATPVTPVLEGVTPVTPSTASVEVGEPNALQKPGVPFGRFIASLVGGRVTKGGAAGFYKAKFRTEDMVHAALLASEPLSGGVTVPSPIYANMAPLLQARALVRRSGAEVVPLPNGQTTITRATGGATFSRVAEGSEQNASSPTFGAVTLTAKKMLGLIPISNDLIAFSAQQIDQIVTKQGIEGIAVAEDVDFLRGTGVGANPKGMRYIATTAAGNLLTMTGTPDVAKIQYDLQRIVLALAGSNVPMRNCFWGFSPRVALYLQYLLNSAGLRVFPSMDNGTLMGYPFASSTSIPINLGGGTESEIYFWDAAECVIGDAQSIRVDMSTEASYKNEAGTLVSAFSKDETILRLVLSNDFAMFHNAGCAVMTGVTWGYTAP